jgi:hypothetical protein
MSQRQTAFPVKNQVLPVVPYSFLSRIWTRDPTTYRHTTDATKTPQQQTLAKNSSSHGIDGAWCPAAFNLLPVLELGTDIRLSVADENHGGTSPERTALG